MISIKSYYIRYLPLDGLRGTASAAVVYRKHLAEKYTANTVYLMNLLWNHQEFRFILLKLLVWHLLSGLHIL